MGAGGSTGRTAALFQGSARRIGPRALRKWGRLGKCNTLDAHIPSHELPLALAACAGGGGPKQKKLSPMAAPAEILAALGLGAENLGCYDGRSWRAGGALVPSLCPSTGGTLAQVRQGTEEDYEACMGATVTARRAWAETPAPARGEIVRKIGDALRAKKQVRARQRNCRPVSPLCSTPTPPPPLLPWGAVAGHADFHGDGQGAERGPGRGPGVH